MREIEDGASSNATLGGSRVGDFQEGERRFCKAHIVIDTARA